MLSASAVNWQTITDTPILAKFAIDAAIYNNWQIAIKINQKIVEISPEDVEALNRLAHAYLCLGKMEKAKKIYAKVLEINPFNIIARKNLEKVSKLATVKNGRTNGDDTTTMGNPSAIFLYEPGKTKIINLLNLAPPIILANLTCAQKLSIIAKKHQVHIISGDGTYLGALPDDLAHRLIAFIEGGNQYEVYVKQASTKSLSVFVKEISRSDKYSNQPTFTDSKSNLVVS